MDSKVQSLIFAILRSALGIEKMAVPLSLKPCQWKRLFNAVSCQQVAALVYDELESTGNNMPESLRLQWQSYLQFSRNHFDTQLMALVRLSTILAGHNVRMMVLKGMGLALTYPKPELRECGDIDIYCFDDYDKVNELVVSSGLDSDAHLTEERHFGFMVDGIEVENHWKFCSDINNATTYMGNVLMDMAHRDYREEARIPGVLFPSVQMGALYVITHTLTHLCWSGICLRHLCDVAMYMRMYRNQIDFDRLHASFTQAGLEKPVAMLLGLCNACLGLSLDLAGWKQYETDSEAKTVLHSIFHPIESSGLTRDPLLKMYRKIYMYRFRSKLHGIVYNEKFPDSFIQSFVCLKNNGKEQL